MRVIQVELKSKVWELAGS